MANSTKGEQAVILLVTVTPKPDKRARAEELWKLTVDDVNTNEVGRVRYDVLFDEQRGQYTVYQEYASEQIMKEYRDKPFHMEISEKVKSEGLLDHWPEGDEVKVCRRVMR